MRFKTLIIIFLFLSPLANADASKIEFWNTQRKGTNLFNSVEKLERLKMAKEFGVQLIRLAPNKWLNGRPESELGDFLIGRPGEFKTINVSDVKALKSVLDDANKVGLKVVLTMLSLPNARWKQHNNDVEERAIWADFKNQEASLQFWKQLAIALKGHPALVGYNLRNEPSPELSSVKLNDWYTGDYEGWYKKVKDTPADINLFYRKLVKVIREIDADIPIVIDSGFYATAWGFKVLEPINDDKVIYSFHMYEPYSYNSQFNKGKYTYPGKAPIGELSKNPPIINWDKHQLETYLQPISDWQRKHNIPNSRIFVGEVGVFRSNAGATEYLKDITNILNEKKWHWAFYSFREDTWAGMDYELGTKEKAGWKYWQAIEGGKIPGPDVYKQNPLSKILKAAIKAVNSESRSND